MKRGLAEIRIPFNRPYLTGRELEYISEAHANHHLSGDGPFTKRCNAWLERTVGCPKALLTHSCTAALEMAAILIDIRPGDEASFTSYRPRTRCAAAACRCSSTSATTP
jgi:dTDP-4-amino-4,6-dideoxygalactose transaminase